MAALKKSEKRLLIGLGVVVVIFVINLLTSGGGEEGAPAISLPNRPNRNRPKTTETKTAETISLDSLNLYSEWGRDPFKPVTMPYETEDTGPDLTLKGIIWREGVPYVLINEFILKEGETKEGITITHINNNRVTGRQRGKPFTLIWKG